jgi:hypothetical protein
MTRLAVFVALLVSLGACGGNSTSTPTSPEPPTFSIVGTVFGNGKALAGATVAITDGIYAGQIRDATDAGGYFFADLVPSVVTIQASYDGYAPQTKTVILASGNQRVDFVLTDH